MSDGSAEVVVARTPNSCMHKALKETFDLIAVIFTRGLLREHKALVALCAALRRNPDTAKVPLLAILTSRHPLVLKWLRHVGVQYGIIVQHEKMVLQEYLELLPFQPTDEHKLERILSQICPYINYIPVALTKEVACCGAYSNCLIMGRYQLKQCCKTERHKECEYYKNPRAT